MSAAVAQVPVRRIPSTGEEIPAVGIGTWVAFNVAPGDQRYNGLPDVLNALFSAGGGVIDSSPMYGRAEETVGELLAVTASQHKCFVATKVWTRGREAGIAEMQRSIRRLRVERLDLMQIHNLVDWRTHLATLRDWKERGIVRYLGVTHYRAQAHAELEVVLRAESVDFIQINYSMLEPEAAKRILPLAADRGVAVLANRPFGEKSLAQRVADRSLPGWAADIGAHTWNDLGIAFVLSHEAVTCAIPGTGNATHMAANCAAAGITLSAVQQRALIALLR